MKYKNPPSDHCDKDTFLPLAVLAGNPNVGKSSVFNLLTGLHQHTGNWSGKTVGNTLCRISLNDKEVNLADLPGAYSIEPASEEERAARDILLFSSPDVVIYVCGARTLERNLIMLMQLSEICSHIIVCVNMLDELDDDKHDIDLVFLEKALGMRVIGISAKRKQGINELKNAISDALGTVRPEKRDLYYDDCTESMISELTAVIETCEEIQIPRACAIHLLCKDVSFSNAMKELYADNKTRIESAEKKAQMMIDNCGYDVRERITMHLAERSARIAEECLKFHESTRDGSTRTDEYITSKLFAFPMMFILLLLIFWITVSAANVPSSLLNSFFSSLEPYLISALSTTKLPLILTEMFVYGIYRVVTWIVAVMLPPMAIFFPLFTLLEDSGYLPRIAFNLDRTFSTCGGCGKQALTACMGFGCNAVGVSGCRIIGSERERLTAIITNNFSPCNGRFPILIAVISMFSKDTSDVTVSLILALLIILSFLMSLAASKLLSVTVLKGEQSAFVLELPPYRMPQFGSVIVRSVLDRTLFVLARAVCFAAPCGAVIWLLANINIGNATLLTSVCDLLEPLARPFGLDGVILLAFVLGLPANEIVIPIIMMSYLASGELVGYENLSELKTLFTDNGWTIKTAVCTCVFTLMHWPCATTIMTAAKETKSLKYTVLTVAIPTAAGLAICFILNLLFTAAGY